MGILTNPRHELFAQELAKGKSATEAYTLAGYKPCRQNAARLTTNDDIRARLAEIQAQAATKSEVTVQSLLDELEHARARADSLDQLGAAVKAISEKAKISGLLTTKIEITNNSGDTPDDWVNAMLSGPGSPIEQFRPVDERDRQGLKDLVERAACEIAEYLAALKARPVCAERVDPANLPSRWQDLRRYSAVPRRITNR
ncbi:MAG: terminase small subunit [Pseudolabrys sp.]|jgi:hypothetical protein